MCGFHGGRGQFAAPGDLLAETARDVAAHERADRPADRALGDRLLDECMLGIEALRVADRELETAAVRNCDQLVGLMQFNRDRLFEEHVLSGKQAVACHRIVRALRRSRDIDRLDFLDLEQFAVVRGSGAWAGGLRDLGQAFRTRFGDMQASHQRVTGARLGTNTAAPAGANDCDFHGFHSTSSQWAGSRRSRRQVQGKGNAAEFGDFWCIL